MYTNEDAALENQTCCRCNRYIDMNSELDGNCHCWLVTLDIEEMSFKLSGVTLPGGWETGAVTWSGEEYVH